MSMLIKQYLFELEKLRDERDWVLYCNTYVHMDDKDRKFNFTADRVQEEISKVPTEELLKRAKEIRAKVKEGKVKKYKTGDKLPSNV